MQALAAAAGLPVRAVRVVPEPLDQGEVRPAVVGAEQRRRLGPRPHHAGLARRAGAQLPHPGERGAGRLGEPDRALLRLAPRLAEVVGVHHGRAPVPAHRPGEQPAAAVTGVDADRRDLLHRQVRGAHRPGLPIVVAAGEEEALAGADGEQGIGGHGSSFIPVRNTVARLAADGVTAYAQTVAGPENHRHTDSGIEVKPLYTADDLAGWDPEAQLGAPGEPPYTRGIYPTMYRGRLWTMRQYAGFGTAESTNARYKFLLAHGQTGLSCAFDLPTQMGFDSDHPRAEGEVGKVGVAIDSIADMRRLLDGIPLDQVTTSMTINSTASILLLLYELVAEEQGVPSTAISGTIQNDMLKEYIARGTYIYPPRPSMRIITDIFAYCAANVPKWNTISISGYHIREAGSTAVQEIAFTLANAHRLRAGGDRRRARRRRLRAAAVVLLERAQQLLRGGRQVPRRPADVGPDHERALRRADARRASCCASTPRPAGRRSPRSSR